MESVVVHCAEQVGCNNTSLQLLLLQCMFEWAAVSSLVKFDGKNVHVRLFMFPHLLTETIAVLDSAVAQDPGRLLLRFVCEGRSMMRSLATTISSIWYQHQPVPVGSQRLRGRG